MKKLFLSLLFSVFCILTVTAQEKNFIEENYDKHTWQVPMRDGVKLHTIVYTPKDKSQAYPFLMMRSPYSSAPYGDFIPHRLSPNKWLYEDLYIFVFQDVRGKFMSEGEFVNMRPVLTERRSDNDVDETTDTWDTVDWLIKNIENNNGRAGIYGNSYLGFYAAMGAINAHPAMKASSPQAPISDWYLWDDMHHNGAFALPLTFNFFQVFGQPRPELTTSWPEPMVKPAGDSYHYFLELGPVKNVKEKFFGDTIAFWNDIVAHPDYGEFWKARSSLPHLNDISPAVLTVGGWYDGEDLSGALHTYKTIEMNDKDADNRLVMGPWTHGGWQMPGRNDPSLVPFREEDKYFYQREIEYPFFSYYLKGKGTADLPDAWVFETGSAQWRAYDAWPPEGLQEQSLFLEAGGTLAFREPGPGSKDRSGTNASGQAPYDEFISDPARPVPYSARFHGARSFYHRQYLSEDQRFAATRPDVLVYEGEALQEDVTLAGPVEVELYVSTTGTDADWVVKLIDVYPDTAANPGLDAREVEIGGYQMLVRGDIFRGKYRNSFEKPEPFVPGEVTRVSFLLPDINHCFREGHRIMVQVQSSWFPLFDRNPQTFTNIYTCNEDAFRKAVHRVWHTPEYPSRVVVHALPATEE